MTIVPTKSNAIALQPQDLRHWNGEGSGEEIEKDTNIFTANTHVIFEGQCFQFSGMLEFGRREDAVLVVNALGAYTPGGHGLPNIVNYLVVGDLENRAHRRNGYGGVITKAIERNKNEPQHIHIIPEREFVRAAVKSLFGRNVKSPSLTSTNFTYKSLLDRASKAKRSMNDSARSSAGKFQ